MVVTSSEVPRFQEHPHQWQLNTLLFLISAMGALAFAMAAVLVSQSMRAVLAGQVLLLSFLVLTVGAIDNASAVGVEVLQRTRELGLLGSWPLTRVATGFFGDLMLGEGARLEPAFSALGLMATLIATFGFGWLASWFPARSALRVPTHQALAARA